MQKGFMYIDETVTLDFEMPDELKKEIELMEKAFADNDESTWDLYHETIGVFAKGLHSEGKLTSEQMHKIWERYGTAG